MTRIAVFLILFIALFLTGQQSFAQTEEISIKFGTKSRSVKKGSISKGELIIEIPQGLHVNSNRPTGEYMIPTIVMLTGDGVTINEIIYPEGENKTFPFSPVPISVYDGRVVIPFEFSIPRNFKARSAKLSAKVNFQACTDEVCYQPESRTVELTLRIR